MGMPAIQDRLNKLSYSHPIKAPYEIWLCLAQWFLRRRCLKSVDNVLHTTEAYLSFKVTNEPKASAELKPLPQLDESMTWPLTW